LSVLDSGEVLLGLAGFTASRELLDNGEVDQWNDRKETDTDQRSNGSGLLSFGCGVGGDLRLGRPLSVFVVGDDLGVGVGAHGKRPFMWD
jgi:hypothetical protein